MDEADRLLARAFSDIELYRRVLALMPYTVHVDHEQQRARERARERAVRLLSCTVPTQRGAEPTVHRLTTPRRSSQGGHL